MYYNELINKRNELENKKSLILNNMTNYPDGNLRISKHNRNIQYYHIIERGDSTGTYINQQSKDVITSLAQKGYEEKLLKQINLQLKAIDTFLTHYNPAKLGAIYDSLNPDRKSFVNPLYLSDSEYIKRWQDEPYIGNTVFPEELKHETLKGEFVRTKSEKAIANIYYEMGIPYKYEAPTTLFDGKIVYPDFTLLNIKTRTLIYHEHLGLLEDEKYRKKNLLKMSNYNRNGIILGSNFFITYETDYCPLNDNQIKNTIRAIFR